MNTEINTFIDYDGIFEMLFKEHSEVLKEYSYEATHYGQILDFYHHLKKDFPIMPEECELDNQYISFVFGQSFNDANESNNQPTTANVHIIFDTVLAEFTHYEYEQG